MIELFVASFAVTTFATLACWALVFSTVPVLRLAHPEHFVSAGRPKVLSWHLLNLSFLRYLFSDAFRTLPDPKLASRLKALRAFWLIGLPALATMFAAVLSRVGA